MQRRWSVALIVIVAAVVTTVLALRPRDSATPLDPNLVAVAPLANETGDATFGPLGRLAAERIAQGIQQHGVAEVVPPVVALTTAEEAQRASDGVQTFARATGAGVVLHGAYYLLGDSLQFQIQITDAVDGKLMSALAPVTGPVEPATEVLGLARERVLGALAAALDLRSGALHLPMQPRSLEVYRVFQQADYHDQNHDVEEAVRLYRQAWAMDSTFYPALVLLAAWLQTGRARRAWGDAARAEADSLFRIAERYRDRMTEAERLFLQGPLDRRRGVGPEAHLRRLRRLAELAPYYRQAAAGAAWRAYRPREALELLTRVDTVNPYFLSTPGKLGGYRAIKMASHHMLENYEEELEAARAARRESPRDLGVWEDHLRAVAALGRIDELDALLDTVYALPMQELGSGRFRTPASMAANFVAMELRAHGYPDAARAVLQRALDWLEARPAEEAQQIGSGYSHSSYSHLVGDCLYKLERWEGARTLYEELLAESPQDTVALARLGAIAVRQGDAARARAISDQLAEHPGGQTLGRARIAALLGEREDAMAFLREAYHQIGTTGINRNWGWFVMQRHWEMDLESLHGYPPFELFMRPRE